MYYLNDDIKHCFKSRKDDEKPISESFNEKIKELESSVKKQLSNSDETMKDTLKQFKDNLDKKVQVDVSEAARKIDEMASNVEQRIQLREREIDSSIRLSIKEVEGSIKVFEKEVESFMRKVVRNIEDNVAKAEIESKTRIEEMENNMRYFVNGVKSEVKKIFQQVVSTTNYNNSDDNGIFEHKSDSKIDDFESTEYEDQLNLANSASVPPDEEIDKEDERMREQQLVDSSIWLAVACERGEECRRPNWLGEEFHYIYDPDYYVKKHAKSGNYNEGITGDCCNQWKPSLNGIY